MIQIDEPHLCVLVDPAVRAKFADPEGEMSRAVDMINRIVERSERGDAGGPPLPSQLGRRGGGPRAGTRRSCRTSGAQGRAADDGVQHPRSRGTSPCCASCRPT